ncbi:hypothetical protein ACMHYB_62000 [Sorangium sp. So ce1128]
METILPDGSRLRYGYDAMLRLAWIETAAGERQLFQRDAAGQITGERTFAGVDVRYSTCSGGASRASTRKARRCG